MNVTISHRFKPVTHSTEEKVAGLVVPLVQALRDAYIAAHISDEESATVDLLSDILVYATRVESEDVDDLAARAVRAAHGELQDAEYERRTS
jgi:hypothetical protein